MATQGVSSQIHCPPVLRCKPLAAGYCPSKGGAGFQLKGTTSRESWAQAVGNPALPQASRLLSSHPSRPCFQPRPRAPDAPSGETCPVSPRPPVQEEPLWFPSVYPATPGSHSTAAPSARSAREPPPSPAATQRAPSPRPTLGKESDPLVSSHPSHPGDVGGSLFFRWACHGLPCGMPPRPLQAVPERAPPFWTWEHSSAKQGRSSGADISVLRGQNSATQAVAKGLPRSGKAPDAPSARHYPQPPRPVSAPV